MTVSAKMKWDVDPVTAVKDLSRGLRNKGMRIALNKASAPAKSAMVGDVPVSSGTLAKSIRIRLKEYKDKQTWVSIVGPSSAVKRNVKVGKKVRGKKQKRILQRPSKYYPLLEYGTKYIRAMKITEAAMSQVAGRFPQILSASLREQIEQLLRK